MIELGFHSHELRTGDLGTTLNYYTLSGFDLYLLSSRWLILCLVRDHTSAFNRLFYLIDLGIMIHDILGL
jgi:hypothetical protein